MRKLIALCFIAFYSFTLAMPSVLAASSFETLRGGTTVRVTLPQISTIGLGVGATIDGSCDSGVSIQGIEFVRPGAAVKLRVSSVVPPKGLGKPGELTLQAVSVRCVDGSDVPLRGGYIENQEISNIFYETAQLIYQDHKLEDRLMYFLYYDIFATLVELYVKIIDAKQLP